MMLHPSQDWELWPNCDVDATVLMRCPRPDCRYPDVEVRSVREAIEMGWKHDRTYHKDVCLCFGLDHRDTCPEWRLPL